MSKLNSVRRRRLLKLPQFPNVWEGDRCSLIPDGLQPPQEEWVTKLGPLGLPEFGNIVFWADSTQQNIRSALPMTTASALDEIVEAFLHGIESPPNGLDPSRPTKIVVRDQEIFSGLESIAKSLEITLELVSELPMIDRILEKFQEFQNNPPSMISPIYGDLLLASAQKVWETAPWVLLADHQILEVTLNQWGLGTVYISILGNLGLELSILAYRSLESLKEFRTFAISDRSLEVMEAAFLAQDCLFLNYEFEPLKNPGLTRLIPFSRVEPSFGSLGKEMRPFLTDDETIAFAVILEAIHRFVSQNRSCFFRGNFPELTRRHKIPVPEITGLKSPIMVKVSTMPKLAQIFLSEMDEDLNLPDQAIETILQQPLEHDFLPRGSVMMLTALSGQSIALLRSEVPHYQFVNDHLSTGDREVCNIPMMVIRTTAANARDLVKRIASVGGLFGIGFKTGSDLQGQPVKVAILKAMDGTLFYLNTFSDVQSSSQNNLTSWHRDLVNSSYRCGFVVSKGLRGKQVKPPALGDILGLYEFQWLSEEDLSVGELR